MSTMSDLSEDLLRETFSRVPLTSLSAIRSTCKNWNALSENQIFSERATARKQYLGFMLMDYRVCSMKFNLQGIHNDDDTADLSINQVSVFDKVEISKVFHCHGLLLCVTKDNLRLVVWNPYLGQTRWIQPLDSFSKYDMYGFGYDTNKGYHKILRFKRLFCLEIYDCNSNSWRVLDVTPDWDILDYRSIVSLKGNTYVIAQGFKTKETEIGKTDEFSLVSFDFTSERFEPLLPLPVHTLYVYGSKSVTLSCVRDEQLALLYQRNDETWEIWITTNIDPSSVSWSMFLEVDRRFLPWFPTAVMDGTFFVDEAEQKVVVVSNFHEYTTLCCYQTAYIIGEDGYFISVVIKGARIRNKHGYYFPFVCSSYVPSLVQLYIIN